MASWIYQHLLSFIIQYGLDLSYLSERIKGDVYAAGRSAQAHFLLNARSEGLLTEAN